MKSRLIATVVIAIAWMLLDFVFHNLILMGDYAATSQLWRPMAEMSMPLMNVVTILTALVFVLIYCQVVSDKNMNKAVKLGLLCGLLVGIGAGLGSYTYMPITTKIAAIWFIAPVVKFVVSGAIVGKIVTKELS